MSLPCTSNSALIAVNSVANGIKSALASGKSALGELATQANSLKDKVSSLKPSIPALDSLQAELAALKGASAAQITAFRDKWNGKAENLNALISSALSGTLDICKDVPNVKLDPTTGESVTEAKESSPPTENPAKVTALVPTVVDNSKSVSTGKSNEMPSVESEYEITVVTAAREQVLFPVSALWKAAYTPRETAKRDPNYVKAMSKATNWTTYEELRQKVSPAEAAAIESFMELDQKEKHYNSLDRSVINFFKKYQDLSVEKVRGEIGSDEFDALVEKITPNNDRVSAAYLRFDASELEYFNTLKTLIDGNIDLILRYYNYRQNRS